MVMGEKKMIGARVITRCKECKYNYGIANNCEFNPEDIVCIYFETDGQTENDFCSRGKFPGEEDD